MHSRKMTFVGRLALAAVLFLTLNAVDLRAQPALAWFQSTLSQGTGTAEARAVAADRDGNIIVVGRFVAKFTSQQRGAVGQTNLTRLSK